MSDGARPLSRSVFAARLAEYPDVIPGAPPRGRWAEYFRERVGPAFVGRVVLEIGCFDGTLIVPVGRRHPATGFVGIDWKAKAIHTAAGRVTEAGLRNVALLRARGQELGRLCAPGEVDEIWLFHPDPFAEPEALPNRLFAEPFLRAAHRALRPGGRLILKTDHAEYYAAALAIAGSEGVRSLYTREIASADLWNDSAALERVKGRAFTGLRTGFEERFVVKGQPIYYLELVRTA